MVWVLVLALSCHERERAGVGAMVGRSAGAVDSAMSARSKGAICCEKNIPNRFTVAAVLPAAGRVAAAAGSGAVIVR